MVLFYGFIIMCVICLGANAVLFLKDFVKVDFSFGSDFDKEIDKDLNYRGED